MIVDVTAVLRDEGSVIVFRGEELDENGVDYKGTVTFACDHRPAQAIVGALKENLSDICVEIEEWQVISRISTEGEPA